ncbi:MAG TPA: TonB-dependent receptor [Rhizomicrobium sp.]|nr:TonB-dependent receptor [Rhizomicrobium sp.]
MLMQHRAALKSAVCAAALIAGCNAARAEPIEVVVVTAEHKLEAAQNTPIAMSAFTGDDLRAHNILQMKDMIYATPNMAYTNTNFGGATITIRGIGNLVIGAGSESGVATYENDVFMQNPPLVQGTFYDIDNVEVLRGPQSTLYGRSATGGAMVINTKKPDLSGFLADGEVSFGNYTSTEQKATINIPIVDNWLGLRFAADRVTHDGYTHDTYNDTNTNGLDIYSLRGSLRWTPSDATTVDLVVSHMLEDDDSMRAAKQLCATDPTGVLGCLPDKLDNGVVNPNGTFTALLSSSQAFADATGGSTGWAGFTDLNVPFVSPKDGNPASWREINTDIMPKRKAGQNAVSLNWRQNLTSWISANAIGGYQDASDYSLENYNNTAGAPFPEGKLDAILKRASSDKPGGGHSYLDYTADDTRDMDYPPKPAGQLFREAYLPLFTPPGWKPGMPYTSLPVSGVDGTGILSGDPNANLGFFTNTNTIDIAKRSSKQYSAELRFQTSLEGPVNFLGAVNWQRSQDNTDYYVTGNVLTYAAIMGGWLESTIGQVNGHSALDPQVCGQIGCVRGTPFYHNVGRSELESRSAYGEVYYDAIPDELKFTAGARFTQDLKASRNRIFQLARSLPIGTTSEEEAGELAAKNIYRLPYSWEDPSDMSNIKYKGYDFDSTKPGIQLYQTPHAQWDRWSGRTLVNWTPKLNFTDHTMIYASYSRGYKAGGFNPGILADQSAGIGEVYGPEGVDALELGTKNTLFDSTLEFDWSAFYYNYQGMQVSQIINNTAVASNLNAHMYGLDGTVVWAPGDHWKIDANVGLLNSAIGNESLMDPRDPTGGRKDVILIKDYTLSSFVGGNCVLYRNLGKDAAQRDLSMDDMVKKNYLPYGHFAPPGGVGALRAHGIENVLYGRCSQSVNNGGRDIPNGKSHDDLYYDDDTGELLFTDHVDETTTVMDAPDSPYTISDPLKGPDNTEDNSGGVGKNIKGNEIPNAPPITLSVGVQYDFDLDSGYHVVPRVDAYWKGAMWGRVFHDESDRIASSYNLDLQVQVNAPDGKWYVQAYMKNVTNNTNETGEYLASPSSGLYTNLFLDDPQTFGVRLGANF